MDRLTGLEPAKVFDFFDVICDIPHGSGNTAAMLDYLKTFAMERELRYRTDDAGNIVIFKDGSAGYEASEPLILQGHMDMVCAKRPDVQHDFATEPLDLSVEGDDLYAEGTSLGGDDGIAVAFILAILDDDALEHPPIEAVITNDEEIGLLGAAALDASDLSAKRMINLDSEEEGIFICGCAGGSHVDCILPISKIRMKGLPVVITIGGLAGGHSGDKIITGRANASKLMGRFLCGLEDETVFCLENVYGGDRDNVITSEAKAHIVIDEDDLRDVEKYAEKFERDVRREYRGIDEDISVRVEKGSVHKMNVLDRDSQDRVLFFLLHAPQGVRKMSGLIEGLVETSSNLGVVRTGEKEFASAVSTRSSVASGRRAMEAEIGSLVRKCGGSIRVSGEYPEWDFRPSSALRDSMTALYAKMYGTEPTVKAIHAGLECGLFSQKIRGLDAVSIGPDIKEIHSPNEKLSISSTKRVWEYLVELLKRLK